MKEAENEDLKVLDSLYNSTLMPWIKWLSEWSNECIQQGVIAEV